MKKVMWFFLIVAFIASTDTQQAEAFLGATKFTVFVADENGLPVEGATVGVGFEKNTSQGVKTSGQQGITGSDGTFIATGQSNGHITYGADKQGYYNSHYVYDFTKQGLFGWDPWNPEFKVLMRKIENPVPMYARNTTEAHLEIPVVGKDVGFDLIKFDWIPPYGRGQTSDFICYLEIYRGGPHDFEYKLKISFPRPYDGIQIFKEDLQQGSVFKLPRFAPEDGYQKDLDIFIDRNPQGKSTRSYDQSRHYIFRVRSEIENGKLKRALYGKIISDIEIGTKKEGTAYFNFKYYLNPDYTRNLEFDPKRNLFINLPKNEGVGQP